MTEWEPATDAEVAMRDALRTDDQESYFRILSGIDLLLPVSPDALAGLAPLGWGTWSTGGRTHVLAFTSPAALQACLADYTGSARRVAYAELADTWPNLEWWLAVNPGLPIEGYLPAWFVAQLARGDLRLPTRGPGRDSAANAQRPQDLQAAAMAANAAAQGYGSSRPGGPVPPQESSESAPATDLPDQPDTAGGWPGTARPVPEAATAVFPQVTDAGSGASPATTAPPFPTSASPAASGPVSPVSAQPGRIGPGGLPVRSPGEILPSGLPSRVPRAPEDPAAPRSAPPAFPAPQSSAGPQTTAPQSNPPAFPSPQSAPPGTSGFGSPTSGAPTSGMPTSGMPSSGMPTSGMPSSGVPASGTPVPGDTGLEQDRPVSASPASSPVAQSSPAAQFGSGPSSPAAATPQSGPPSGQPHGREGQAQGRGTGLPTRQPMAQTPPLPDHLTPPGERSGDEAGAGRAEPAFATAGDNGDAAPAVAAGTPTRDASEPTGPGGALPRRQVTPMTERPASMAAAAQAIAAGRGAAAEEMAARSTAPSVGRPEPYASPEAYAPSGPPGARPPVVPGAGGEQHATASFAPSSTVRPEVPTSAQPGGPGQLPPETDDFAPANTCERDLLHAAGVGDTDAFLSTLLLATVLVPVADESRPGSTPGEPGFAFRTEPIDGERFLVVFTSRDRVSEHFAEPTRTAAVRFLELIRNWPDEAWSFAVNPSTPIGAKYPGAQVIALANWAAEAGLGVDGEERPTESPAAPPQRATDAAQHATVMQKAVPPHQVDYYLERAYDRVAGFVHRASEVEHLRTPAELYAALGLAQEGTSFPPDAKEAFVLRWPAYRPSLYRIPYGGQSEEALRAMDGWVIERPPFRGNGFAPGEGRDVIAEFKVDSVRLPHGAQLWRMDADGNETMIAVFDGDMPLWRRVGE
nr:SseB family protein [Mangrovihabitans endophyticus]